MISFYLSENVHMGTKGTIRERRDRVCGWEEKPNPFYGYPAGINVARLFFQCWSFCARIQSEEMQSECGHTKKHKMTMEIANATKNKIVGFFFPSCFYRESTISVYYTH